MRTVILDSFTADQGDSRIWGLRPGPTRLDQPVVHPRTAPDQLLERCAGADAVLTNKVVIDAAALAALPDLRYIGVMASGTNVIDLAACRARGVAVTNVPGYSTDSVAQLAFALILHLTHDVAGHSARAKAGEWAAAPDFCFFTRPLTELAGRTLVVVGMGAIGQALAAIARGFGMRVLAAAVPGSTSAGRMPLAEALAQADVVSLHCPLTERTRRLVDGAFLAALKPGALLINTGRGALIDEAALVAALAAGGLGGVGLDVLEREPPPADHPLLDAQAPWAGRVVITPHIAWGTVEARARLVDEVLANLAAWRDGARRNRLD